MMCTTFVLHDYLIFMRCPSGPPDAGLAGDQLLRGLLCERRLPKKKDTQLIMNGVSEAALLLDCFLNICYFSLESSPGKDLGLFSSLRGWLRHFK